MSWLGCWVNLIYIPFCGAKGHSFFTNKFAFLLKKFSFQNKSSLIPIKYTLFLLLTYLDLFYHGEAQVDENQEFFVWTAILDLKLFNVGKINMFNHFLFIWPVLKWWLGYWPNQLWDKPIKTK